MNDEGEKEMDLRLQQQDHWMDAEVFIEKMSKQQMNLTDDTHMYLCFDFQKNLPFPVTNVNKEFFLRQLWLFNFGIRIMKTGQTYFFSYCEHFAKKGSAEVISFIKYYIENIVPNNVRHLHLFCDNSSGQNKHRFLFAYLHSVCPSRFETIHLEFPVPGHSRMTIDGDFAHIEQKKRKQDKIEYPSEWIDLMRSCKENIPFNILYVNFPITDDLTEDGTPIVKVYDYKVSLTPLLKASLGRVAGISGLLFNENGVFTRNSMGGTLYSPFTLLKRNVTVQRLQEVIRDTRLAYEEYLPITPEKFDNLQHLLTEFYRPAENVFYDVINMEPIVELIE